MALQTVIQNLPHDVLQEIGKYLPPVDVNNCCAVNKSWNNAFRKNPCWKRHCDQSVVTYLRSTPCEVGNIGSVLKMDPVIAQMRGNQDESWRVNYIYQNQLRINWMQSRYNERRLTINDDDLNCSFFEFYDNNFVFLIKRNSIKICNVSEPVISFIREFSYDLPFGDTPNDYFRDHHLFYKITDGNFVVSQNNLVKVFDISEILDWSVFYTFLFDKTEEESIVATGSSNVLDYMLPERVARNYIEIINGNVFVGILGSRNLLDNHIVEMHIWNIRSKKKLKVETVPISEPVVNVFMWNSETSSDNLLVECSVKVIVDEKRMLRSHYFVYNLAKLKFYPLRVFNTYPCETGYDIPAKLDDCLYVMDQEGLILYDINQRCQVIRRYPFSGCMFITISGNSVTTLSGDEEMKVMKLHSGDIETFTGNWQSMSCNKLWDKFVVFNNVIDDTFWFVGNNPRRILARDQRYQSHSKLCTKLLIEHVDGFSLLSFW